MLSLLSSPDSAKVRRHCRVAVVTAFTGHTFTSFGERAEHSRPSKDYHHRQRAINLNFDFPKRPGFAAPPSGRRWPTSPAKSCKGQSDSARRPGESHEVKPPQLHGMKTRVRAEQTPGSYHRVLSLRLCSCDRDGVGRAGGMLAVSRRDFVQRTAI